MPRLFCVTLIGRLSLVLAVSQGFTWIPLDVRAGLGMLAAALVAEGETQIDNAQVPSHMLGDVLVKLSTLGARITSA